MRHMLEVQTSQLECFSFVCFQRYVFKSTLRKHSWQNLGYIAT